MGSRQARARWAVRVSIARRGGWRSWATVSGDFERGLAGQASRTVITPHIDAETRRGSDYVKVTLAMTVAAADVAEALARAWQAFRLAAARPLAQARASRHTPRGHASTPRTGTTPKPELVNNPNSNLMSQRWLAGRFI